MKIKVLRYLEWENVKDKLNYTSDNVIDYANSDYRSDFMDIYLTYKCDFFISTGGGLDGKLLSLINQFYILIICQLLNGQFDLINCLFSYKKYFDENEKKFVLFQNH